MDNEDKYYIDKVLNGDVNAYSFIIKKYKKGAFTLAHRIVSNREDAEEICQDAFYKVYIALDDFKWNSRFSTWLYRIVYTTSISRTRSYKKDATFIDDFPIDEYHYNEIETAISSLVEEDRKRYINLALQKLPQEENHIITLFYLMECSVEEISQITGLTRSNIKIKLFRARKVLDVELSRLLRHEVKSILDN